MELQEAIAIASQLKGHFRAFEKLEEVVQQAIAANQYLGEISGRIETLKQQEADLKQSVSDLTEAQAKQVSAHTVRMDTLHEEFSNRMASLEQSHANRAKEIDLHLSEQSTLAHNAIASMEQRKQELAAELGKEEAKLAVTKQAHEELKAKLLGAS